MLNFFLTRPYEQFTASKSADIITAVLFLVVIGVAVSRLLARGQEFKVITIKDKDYLAQIHHTARLAGTATRLRTMIDHVRRQLVGLLA